MRFIGQKRILEELNYLVKDIKNNNVNHNLMFRAPSGYGKTTLGFILIKSFGGLDSCNYYVPDSKGEINFKANKRFLFIDEIHTLGVPEVLYPFMDSNNYTFVLMSNESGGLKEPLRNRCIQLIFDKYSDEDAIEICRGFIPELPDDKLKIIQERIGNNPREIKIYCERISTFFRNSNLGLEEILDRMDIKEDGMNIMDGIYLNVLDRLTTASLNTIVQLTGLDRTTIVSEIEPKLLYTGKILITSKGRSICK